MVALKYLVLPNGKAPCLEWITSLDISTRARVVDYINRLASGSANKNVKALGDGVFELKMNFSSGLRIYFAMEARHLVLLLAGGDKSTQKNDIKNAKNYWKAYYVQSKRFR